MKSYYVHGLQHLGLGTPNLETTWKWYKDHFGLDIPMFDSVAEAELMRPYTNNKTVNKRAAMVYNIQGGAAMEIIELRSEKTMPPPFEVQLGDLGIFAAKMKVPMVNFDTAITELERSNEGWLGGPYELKDNLRVAVLQDPNGLYVQLHQGDSFYSKGPHKTGGISGCIIGCSDIEKTKKFYHLLGYSEVLFEAEGKFEDYAMMPGGKGEFKRCILGQKKPVTGGFSEAFGDTQIELVQALTRTPKKIYQNRIWGDTGFVHLGFDVKGMPKLEVALTAMGHPFTCDSSNGLHMGKTRVHCTYVEDPDGTLIELIEVYKIPIIEKWGIFINIEKRSPYKPLPKMMFRLARFTRIKDDYWEKNSK